jgi:hypothetical protein
VFCWLLPKISFVKKTGIKQWAIIALFVVKIVFGLLLGWLSLSLDNDYWGLHIDVVKEYELLLKEPSHYLDFFFSSSYEKGYGGFLDALPSYWNDLRVTVMAKMLAPLNFFSRGNYYINSLFFNFFVFLGHVAFYRFFVSIYPARKFSVFLCCFLLPSTLYFTAGVQKDGIVFTALALLFYCVHQSLQKKHLSIARLGIIIIAAVTLFLIRSYVIILVAPAIVFWVLSTLLRWQPIKVFSIGYAIVLFLFFGLNKFTDGGFNPMEAVIKKQEAFLMLDKAVTQTALDTLHPTPVSFIKNTPVALRNVFFKPTPFFIPNARIIPSIIETVLLQLLILCAVFFRPKQRQYIAPITAGIFFAFCIFLFIGFIVPNTGSVVRYRSVYLLFLLVPLTVAINWQVAPIGIKVKINLIYSFIHKKLFF